MRHAPTFEMRNHTRRKRNTKIRVNILICHKNRYVRIFRNVELDMNGKEHCNREMRKAFVAQHPELWQKLPTWTDERGFTFRAGFEVEKTWK